MNRTLPKVTILGMFIDSAALLWFCSLSFADFRLGFFELLSVGFPTFWLFRRQKCSALRSDSKWVIVLRRHKWLRFVGPIALMLLLEIIVLILDKEMRAEVPTAVLISILVALNSGTIVGFVLTSRLDAPI